MEPSKSALPLRDPGMRSEVHVVGRPEKALTVLYHIECPHCCNMMGPIALVPGGGMVQHVCDACRNVSSVWADMVFCAGCVKVGTLPRAYNTKPPDFYPCDCGYMTPLDLAPLPQAQLPHVISRPAGNVVWSTVTNSFRPPGANNKLYQTKSFFPPEGVASGVGPLSGVPVEPWIQF